MLTAFLVPSLANQLSALRDCLDKGAAHAAAQRLPEAELLGVRLAVDMFPLHSQVRIAAFQAQEAIYRLRGEEVPEAVLELRTHAATRQEAVGTVGELRAILADALALLGTVGDKEFDAAADAPLAHALPIGMTFDMTGFTYGRDWALAQVSFHAHMAYALLRSAGVPLGKRDVVPHMWAYLRGGAAA